MRNLEKVLRNAQVGQESFEDELLNFLRNNRATQHFSTKLSPNEMLFRTASSTSRMPVNRPPYESDLQAISTAIDRQAKSAMKRYADTKWRARYTTL